MQMLAPHTAVVGLNHRWNTASLCPVYHEQFKQHKVKADWHTGQTGLALQAAHPPTVPWLLHTAMFAHTSSGRFAASFLYSVGVASMSRPRHCAGGGLMEAMRDEPGTWLCGTELLSMPGECVDRLSNTERPQDQHSPPLSRSTHPHHSVVEQGVAEVLAVVAAHLLHAHQVPGGWRALSACSCLPAIGGWGAYHNTRCIWTGPLATLKANRSLP